MNWCIKYLVSTWSYIIVPGGIDLRVAWQKAMLDVQGEDHGQTRWVRDRSGLVGISVFSTYSEYYSCIVVPDCIDSRCLAKV